MVRTAEILRMYEEGVRPAEIARALGISRQAVSSCLMLNAPEKCLRTAKTIRECGVCTERTVEERVCGTRVVADRVVAVVCDGCKAEDAFRCRRCGNIGEYREFAYSNKKTHIGTCIACAKTMVKVQNRKWKDGHKEEWLEYQRRHRAEKKRRNDDILQKRPETDNQP